MHKLQSLKKNRMFLWSCTFTSIFHKVGHGVGEESIGLIHLWIQGRRMQFKSDLAHKTSSRKHLYVQGVTVYYSPWHHPFQKLVLTICFSYLNWISSFLLYGEQNPRIILIHITTRWCSKSNVVLFYKILIFSNAYIWYFLTFNWKDSFMRPWPQTVADID